MGALSQNTTADGSILASSVTTAELTATCAMLIACVMSMSAFGSFTHVEYGNRSTSGIHDEEMCRLLPVAEAGNAGDKAVVEVPGDA
jgi:uncharacterized protein (DUF169 family)